jgi:hypothetical protein
MIHRLGRPARLVLVSVWTACDSLLIRRPIWTLSSDIQDREDQNRSLVRGRFPGHPHQLTTERGYHFKFTVLPEVVAQPVFSVSASLRGRATPDSCNWSNGRFPGSPHSNACYGSNPSTSYIPMNLRYSAIFCDAAADGFGMTSHWSPMLRRRSARTG